MMFRTLRYCAVVIVALIATAHSYPSNFLNDHEILDPAQKQDLIKRAAGETAECSVLATCPHGQTQIQNIDIIATYVDSNRDGSGKCNWRLGNEMPPRCMTRLTWAQTSVGVPPAQTGNSAELRWTVARGGGMTCTYTWKFRLQFDIASRTRGTLYYLEGSSSVTEVCTGVDQCIETSEVETSPCKINLTGCNIHIP